MAESNTNLSASVLGGSDAIFDFYCEPCDSENLNVEACGYCEQCQEYMCDNCTRNHRKYAAFRSHKILEEANMPKGKIIRKVIDTLTETCPTHVDKVLEFFCAGHKELCCSVCLHKTHKTCKDTAYIPDISDGVVNSHEYKGLIIKFDRVVARATKEQMKFGLNDRDNDAYRNKAVTNIKAFRKKVDKELDRAEQDAISEVSALHRENSCRLKSAEQKCMSVLSDAKVITTGLAKKSKASKRNQVFVEMKLATRRLAAIETELKDAADCKIAHYVFNQDEKAQDMVSSLFAIWSLPVQQDGNDIKARHLQDVNVKAVDDTKDCEVNGIAVLTGARLVITDGKNVAVKLIDMELNKVTSYLHMSSKPYALTRTEASQVAVSLGDKRKIEILTVTDILSISCTIDVENYVQGFSYIGDTFVLAFPRVRSVKTVDMSGRVLSTVYTDIDADPLFNYPWFNALNEGKDVLYVSDREAKSLTTMTLEGKIISVYRHDSAFPVGVTVGREGAVYVCYNDQTVHHLSGTGQHVKILLDQERGLAPFPYAIAYDEDGDRLIVSSGSPKPEYRNYVKLFQLE